ncbi:MAG TPA: flagellar biosynthetic protein FliR [Pirellulales bacterium]|jgi:flagellar biosynthetic protein FliR|nr:flagellar biosynthetic protein FliR [Pirellulales bacterium]
MFDPLLLAAHAVTFGLIVARVAGLFVAAPWLAGIGVPWTVRGLFVFALALILLPTQTAAAIDPALAWPRLVLMGAGELLVGLVLGLGVTIVIGGLQLAGQLIAQLGGLATAELFDPQLDVEVPALSHFLMLFGLTMFMILGGHRIVIGGLIESFAVVPVGSATLSTAPLEALVTMLANGFSLGLRAAAPAVAALLMVAGLASLLARAVPQMNLMTASAGCHALVALGVLGLSLGSIALAMRDEIEPTVELLLRSLAVQ